MIDSILHRPIDIVDERWITVFGFPLNTQAILTEFGIHGTIVSYLVGRGNWIDIQYVIECCHRL